MLSVYFIYMEYRILKRQAIMMRKKGMSYSQIKQSINVSKSTLSNWLYPMPLSEERIKELRDNSPMRIERCRNTKRLKREAKLEETYRWSANEIGKLSKREFFLCGLFLYWAEGGKTQNGTACLTNTNPNMLKFFLQWLDIFNIPMSKIRVHLHLYSDMDVKKQEKFWSEELKIPLIQFKKSYIKYSLSSDITYKNGFGQGTCTVLVYSTDLSSKILMGIKYIQDSFEF